MKMRENELRNGESDSILSFVLQDLNQVDYFDHKNFG